MYIGKIFNPIKIKVRPSNPSKLIRQNTIYLAPFKYQNQSSLIQQQRGRHYFYHIENCYDHSDSKGIGFQCSSIFFNQKKYYHRSMNVYNGGGSSSSSSSNDNGDASTSSSSGGKKGSWCADIVNKARSMEFEGKREEAKEILKREIMIPYERQQKGDSIGNEKKVSRKSYFDSCVIFYDDKTVLSSIAMTEKEKMMSKFYEHCSKGELRDAKHIISKALLEYPNDLSIKLEIISLIFVPQFETIVTSYEVKYQCEQVIRHPDATDIDHVEAFFALSHYFAIVENNREKTLKCTEKILELLPRHSNALYRKAMILYADGRRDEAIPILHDLLKLSPNNFQANFMLSRCYFESGNEKEFKKYSDIAKKLDPQTYKDLLYSSEW